VFGLKFSLPTLSVGHNMVCVCKCDDHFSDFFLGFSENKETGKCDIKVQEQSYQVRPAVCLDLDTHSDSGQYCKHI